MIVQVKPEFHDTSPSVQEVVYNWVMDCFHAISPSFYYAPQSECLIAMPLWFQRLLGDGIRCATGQNLGSEFSNMLGWKIIPGYEDAIVVFRPNAMQYHSEGNPWVQKFPFAEAEKLDFIDDAVYLSDHEQEK